MWNETATGKGQNYGMVDVILCPVGPGVAPKHNTAKYWGYTALWNLLDYPAVVFPVSNANQNIDILPKDFRPMSGKDEENRALCESRP